MAIDIACALYFGFNKIKCKDELWRKCTCSACREWSRCSKWSTGLSIAAALIGEIIAPWGGGIVAGLAVWNITTNICIALAILEWFHCMGIIHY